MSLSPALNWKAEDLWLVLETIYPGFTIEILPELPSSNTTLLDRARAGQTWPVILVTEHQTAGRGRQGKVWQSGTSGSSLTFSLGLPMQRADLSGLSLCVGTVLAEVLHPDVKIKWPNDLWVNQGLGHFNKLGGILIETVSMPKTESIGAQQQGRYVVIGMGINISARQLQKTDPLSAATANDLNHSNHLNHQTPSGIDAIGLQEINPAATAPDALHAIVPALVEALQIFEKDGFQAFKTRFENKDALRHQKIRTSENLTGVASGVDESGRLCIQDGENCHKIVSGDISIRLQS